MHCLSYFNSHPQDAGTVGLLSGDESSLVRLPIEQSWNGVVEVPEVLLSRIRYWTTLNRAADEGKESQYDCLSGNTVNDHRHYSCSGNTGQWRRSWDFGRGQFRRA